MFVTELNCPSCSRRIRLRQAPAPGQYLCCPRCAHSFPAPAEGTAGANGSPAGEPSAPWWVPQETAPAPARPSAVPAAAVAPDSAPRRGLLLAVVVGGLVLLVGTTLLAVRLAARSDTNQAAQAAGDSDRSPDSASPEQRSAAVESPLTAAGASEPDRRVALDDPGRAPPSADLRRELTPPGADDAGAPRAPTLPGADAPGAPKDAPAATEPVGTPAPESSWLPRAMQDEVNKAIDRAWPTSRASSAPSGAWESNHPTGYAALPALTLLECGVPASDPLVQKAAAFVRGGVKRTRNMQTYQLSLALLFLDRLGEEKDRPLIRYIALRLVAGQTPDGGWTYNLPDLTPKEENDLERFLQQTRPEDLGGWCSCPTAAGWIRRPFAPTTRGRAINRALRPDRAGSPVPTADSNRAAHRGLRDQSAGAFGRRRQASRSRAAEERRGAKEALDGSRDAQGGREIACQVAHGPRGRRCR